MHRMIVSLLNPTSLLSARLPNLTARIWRVMFARKCFRELCKEVYLSQSKASQKCGNCCEAFGHRVVTPRFARYVDCAGKNTGRVFTRLSKFFRAYWKLHRGLRCFCAARNRFTIFLNAIESFSSSQAVRIVFSK